MDQKTLDRLRTDAKGSLWNRLSWVRVDPHVLLELVHLVELGRYLEDKMRPHMEMEVEKCLQSLQSSPSTPLSPGLPTASGQ